MTDPQPKKSDLPTRVASAVVMVAVAGTALWLGGWWWTALLVIIAVGLINEWAALSFAISKPAWGRTLWLLCGLFYIGFAAFFLWAAREHDISKPLMLIALVAAVDIGAYFCGRAIGGPKIAPSVSPSKTWAGLVGGIFAATGVLALYGAWAAIAAPSEYHIADAVRWLPTHLAAGCLIAVLAQGGDFFESWMKRRAGVKDSGTLLPGHGGLFDRLDGLLALTVVDGLFQWLAGNL